MMEQLAVFAKHVDSVGSLISDINKWIKENELTVIGVTQAIDTFSNSIYITILYRKS